MRPEENILFCGIASDDCIRMLDCFNVETKKYRPGSCIADFSKQNDKVGILLSGRAVTVKYDINGVRTIIENIEEQGVFGKLFTFSGSNRDTVHVISETECKVLFIRYSELTKRCRNACECHSAVIRNMLMLMSEKAVSLAERIEVLSQRTIEDKLISCLQIIEDKTPIGKTPEIPFSTTALSDYLCVNRSALQREITKLKNQGVLTISKRKFRLERNNEL